MIWDFSKIVITQEILTIIGEIDEFKGTWQSLGRLAPDKLQFLRKTATIESVGSSTRIEGSKLSDKEVEILLSGLQTSSFISRDEQEVAGYAFVCEEIFQGFESIDFSENVIKQFHRWLLKFSHKDERHHGEYKKLSNNVEAFDENGKSLGVVFETATPFETPMQMEELVFWVKDQSELKIIHPLIVIGIFIVIFLAIHPFQDGNGRLSRILTTLLLLKSKYLYVAYSSLESIIEQNKESYYLSLRRTQTTLKTENPDFTPWLTFFLRSLQKQKRRLESKVIREKVLSAKLSNLSNQIISLLHEKGRLSLGDITLLSQSNINTVKKTLAKLVKDGHILRGGQGKGSWYTLP